MIFLQNITKETFFRFDNPLSYQQTHAYYCFTLFLNPDKPFVFSKVRPVIVVNSRFKMLVTRLAFYHYTWMFKQLKDFRLAQSNNGYHPSCVSIDRRLMTFIRDAHSKSAL